MENQSADQRRLPDAARGGTGAVSQLPRQSRRGSVILNRSGQVVDEDWHAYDLLESGPAEFVRSLAC